MSLIIFDCDGVLVDSEGIAREVFARALTEAGFAMTAEQAGRQFTGLSLASCQVWIEAHFGRPLPPDFFAALQRATYAEFAKSLKPVEGIEDVLIWLQQKDMPCCVASSGSYEKINFTLSHTGLLRYLAPHIFSAQSVARGKPAPDLFLYACKQMGVAPTEAVVVEDSSPGVAAAVAAGIYVVGFGQDVPACAGVRIESMEALPAVIDHWQRAQGFR